MRKPNIGNKPQTESDIEKQIISYLRISGYEAYKINNTKQFNQKLNCYVNPSNFKYGVPDIFFCGKGKSGWLEVKAPISLKHIVSNYEKYRDDVNYWSAKPMRKRVHCQLNFLKNIRDQGLIGEFVDSVEMVSEIINQV